MNPPMHPPTGVPALVCPVELGALARAGDDLECEAGHRFPVVNGIPRILVSDDAYTDAFGEQWRVFRLTQLDSYTRTTISRDRLARCVGPYLWARLKGDETLQVLEAGCGAGRFTEILLGCPGACVTSTDLSGAVDTNLENFPSSSRHRVVQCDILRLPFASGAFDVVICLGVLQHTPDPEAAIRALFERVRPGGWLVIDHYAPSFAHATKFTANVLRPLFKRLSPERGTWATERLTRAFFPLHRAVRRHRWAQAVLSRVSPILTYFQSLPELDDRLQMEWALLDTHDSLTDWYKHRRTPAQIAEALEAAGGTEVVASRGGNGVEARCRRPRTAS